MKLIVGLGNPGSKFGSTRHNIGFLVIQELAAAHKIKLKKIGYLKSKFGEGFIARHKVGLAFPLTYMNLSGVAVSAILARNKIPLHQMMVVCDDLNLSFGTIRIRPGGSAGGHKGLGSIICELNTDEFPRLRIGIGRGRRPSDLTSFVLAPFTKAESRMADESIQGAALACEAWIKEGIGSCMNRFNVKMR